MKNFVQYQNPDTPSLYGRLRLRTHAVECAGAQRPVHRLSRSQLRGKLSCEPRLPRLRTFPSIGLLSTSVGLECLSTNPNDLDQLSRFRRYLLYDSTSHKAHCRADILSANNKTESVRNHA